MATMHDYSDIDALWEHWQERIALRPDDAPALVLRDILRARGTVMTAQEVAFSLGGVGRAAILGASGFTDCIVALLGDPPLRLRHAFAAFSADADGSIAVTDLASLIRAFDDDADEAALVANEVDADGDGRLTLDDLTRYLGTIPPGAGTYRATHLAARHIGTGPARPVLAVAPPPAPVAHDADAGLSPLSLRIGFFRLMQGAAYRSFRANYTANSETHLRARDLPYTIEDFASFTTATIDYFLSLGIVRGQDCIAEFRRLDAMVQEERARLHVRIADWPTLAKTAQMRTAQASLADERDDLTRRRDLCRAVMESVLSLRMHCLGLDRAGTDALAHHEINRLRHADMRAETHCVIAPVPETHDYLATWNRVILTAQDDRIDGAIMPTRFWYDTFMPQLLLCASILTDEDLRTEQDTSDADLDAWHAALLAEGAFDRFATDLSDGFAVCSRDSKLSLRQAWLLTAPYLAGVEKRREREDFGRDSGFLSQYVAFVDVPLGRHDIATADMRLSFPYYIGPAVWGLLHGSAELVEAMPDTVRAEAIALFTAFFRAFATMYPCPYCRYHLNRYVIRNREVDMYPLEFLLLGHDPARHDLAITLDDKLATIIAPGGLRTFLWKLHNAVSSSIARTEPWYHRQPEPLYTTRFWPGIEAEMARAAADGQTSVAVERVTEIYAITKPAAHLAVLRDELALALNDDDRDRVASTIDRAETAIAELTQALGSTAYLTRTYAYDPMKVDTPGDVDAKQEEFARSGLFVER